MTGAASGFQIGFPTHGLLVAVSGRVAKNPRDFWDWAWLSTPTTVRVGGFLAELPEAQLMWTEIRRFRVELEIVDRDLAGTARLESVDHWLSLEVEASRSGHLQIRGEARDSVSSGRHNKLRFQIDDLDQTHLPSITSQLRAVEDRYAIPARFLTAEDV